MSGATIGPTTATSTHMYDTAVTRVRPVARRSYR